MKINSIIDLVKDLDTSRQTKNLNKLLIRILLHLQVEFSVYESVANFILIKYPITLKEALQKAFAEQSYKVKFMNEPDINTHLRITLGRPEQNRIVIDTIKEIASK